jgi:hypothetical protein
MLSERIASGWRSLGRRWLGPLQIRRPGTSSPVSRATPLIRLVRFPANGRERPHTSI